MIATGALKREENRDRLLTTTLSFPDIFQTPKDMSTYTCLINIHILRQCFLGTGVLTHAHKIYATSTLSYLLLSLNAPHPDPIPESGQ